MKAYTEEIFGPVLCVVTVDTLDEVSLQHCLQSEPYLPGNRANQLQPVRQRDGDLHEQRSDCQKILQRDRRWADRGETRLAGYDPKGIISEH